MRGLNLLIVSAGLASATAIDSTKKRGPNSVVSGFSSFESEIDSLQLSGFDSSLYSIGNLGNLNVGGLDLGSFDLSNSNDLASILLQLGGGLCLNNVFSLNSFESLDELQELELLQMMAQLYELLELGFLSLNEVQSLFLGGYNQFGGSNSFNLGILRRSYAELKKSIKRTKLRRTPWKRQFQCGELEQELGLGQEQGQVQISNGTATTIQVSQATGAVSGGLGGVSVISGGATATAEASVATVATAATDAVTSPTAAAAS